MTQHKVCLSEMGRNFALCWDLGIQNPRFWQEYKEELYKKDLHDPDNHDGVITHLEPDILECEVKWVLGSITMNKASGGDGISVELFQILKDDAVKGMHSTCQQIWKTQQWPQKWKRSVFIPIPKKGNAKECSNYWTTPLISPASKIILKILQTRHQQYMNRELPDVQAGFRKGRETRDQIANIRGIIEKVREFQKKHLFLLYWLCQSLWLCGSQQTVENSLRDRNTRLPDLPPEKSVWRSRSNSYNWTWNNRLVLNWERSMSRLYIITLVI